MKPGYAEQDPDFYYECMCKAAKRLTSAHPELIKKCISVSSTCFRDTAAYLDENYKPIRPSIIWLD
ncbi:MAG: FGGY family carbohydrate kinase, partial [bacterium]|nr:FGGY family carbohydrate kinase [bacterium]